MMNGCENPTEILKKILYVNLSKGKLPLTE